MELPDYSIKVRAHPSLLRTVRLFAAAVARQAGVAEVEVDDLKLAVAEAANLALAGGASNVELSIRTEDGWLRVRMSPTGVPAGDDLDGFEVIAALFPDAERHADHLEFGVAAGEV